jgi:dolichol-phosphate mannosyltransferase
MSFLILTVQIYRWITFGVPFDGFGTIIGIFLLFSSLLFGILSVLGQYIGLIFEETKSRPLYIIDEVY